MRCDPAPLIRMFRIPNASAMQPLRRWPDPIRATKSAVDRDYFFCVSFAQASFSVIVRLKTNFPGCESASSEK